MSTKVVLIKCPVCPPGIECDHDQDDRKMLCRLRGVAEEPESEAFDASDPKSVNQARGRAKSVAKRAENDLRWLLEHPEGRRFLRALLERCGLRQRSFHPASSDHLATIFLEGQRDVGLGLENDLRRVDPRGYLLMISEGLADAA